MQRPCFRSVLTGLMIATFVFAQPTTAQSLDQSEGAVEVTEPPPPGQARPLPKGKVGRKAAEKYMAPRSSGRSSAGPSDHYLALHFGMFMSDNAYRWSLPDAQSNVGRWNVGVTYRVGEWTNSMDLGIRIDLQSFALAEGRANKLNFTPIVTFPDANSKFPLYFGAGLGPGVFLNQVGNESSISLDYQLFAGVRFFEVVGATGFFIEAGLKNHFLLLSDGQFNGTFAVGGAVFSF